MNNLKVAYNDSLRRLLGLPSYNSASGLFINLNILSFGELLRKYVYNFRNRLEISDNVMICGIYLSYFPLQSGIWDWWRGILLLIYIISVCFVNFYMDCTSEKNI